jgi:hypothetical protein
MFGKALGRPTGKANEDQAEIRQGQIANGDNGETFSALSAPVGTLDGPALQKVNSHLCH